MATYAYLGPVAHSSGNGNLPIRRIVIHCVAGGGPCAAPASGTAKYFQSAAAGGSAHAIADSKRVVECAYDDTVCWHAPPNPHSLGIELECNMSNNGKGHWTQANHIAIMKLSAKWVAEKCIKHGIPPVKLTVAQVKAGNKGICGHVDVTNAFHQSTHTDPGPYFPWDTFMGYVRAEYDQLNNTGNTSNTDAGEPTLSGFTAAQLSQMMYDQNAKYGANLWAAPTGTGTALIKTVNGIASAVGILGSKVDALSKQISDEDLQDDADLAAAKKEIEDGQAALKAAMDQMQQEVQALEAPKA